jgi:hypothetical protein
MSLLLCCIEHESSTPKATYRHAVPWKVNTRRFHLCLSDVQMLVLPISEIVQLETKEGKKKKVKKGKVVPVLN